MLDETMRKPVSMSTVASTLLNDGKWTPSKSAETFLSLNPAIGETVSVLSKGDSANVDVAVRVARVAR
jgi:acyl-CoA reductase-like NAD-dependent aldehyde dehydrogenase